MARVGRIAACLGLSNVVWLAHALAADPLNSNNRPNEEHWPITAPPDAKDDDLERTEHTDSNFVPVVGGSTDLGFSGGYFAGIAQMRKGYSAAIRLLIPDPR